MKKAFFIIVAILFVLSSAFASGSYASNTPPVKSVPPQSVIRNSSPIGGNYRHKFSPGPGIHTKNIFYTYYFDGVYSRYDGYYDRGIIEIAGPNNTSSSNSSTFTIKRTVSNSFSTSIGADADFVSAHTGYNVTFSTSKTWSYTVTVPPYKTVYLHYRDWYHVQKFNCHKHYRLTGENVYGQGWSAQWFAPQFYTTED